MNYTTTILIVLLSSIYGCAFTASEVYFDPVQKNGWKEIDSLKKYIYTCDKYSIKTEKIRIKGRLITTGPILPIIPCLFPMPPFFIRDHTEIIELFVEGELPNYNQKEPFISIQLVTDKFSLRPYKESVSKDYYNKNQTIFSYYFKINLAEISNLKIVFKNYDSMCDILELDFDIKSKFYGGWTQ